MGRGKWYERLRLAVGRMGWRLFLWGNQMTAEKYWKKIYEQEKMILDGAL